MDPTHTAGLVGTDGGGYFCTIRSIMTAEVLVRSLSYLKLLSLEPPLRFLSLKGSRSSRLKNKRRIDKLDNSTSTRQSSEVNNEHRLEGSRVGFCTRCDTVAGTRGPGFAVDRTYIQVSTYEYIPWVLFPALNIPPKPCGVGNLRC
jgi:hypothetical protein